MVNKQISFSSKLEKNMFWFTPKTNIIRYKMMKTFLKSLLRVSNRKNHPIVSLRGCLSDLRKAYKQLRIFITERYTTPEENTFAPKL